MAASKSCTSLSNDTKLNPKLLYEAPDIESYQSEKSPYWEDRVPGQEVESPVCPVDDINRHTAQDNVHYCVPLPYYVEAVGHIGWFPIQAVNIDSSPQGLEISLLPLLPGCAPLHKSKNETTPGSIIASGNHVNLWAPCTTGLRSMNIWRRMEVHRQMVYVKHKCKANSHSLKSQARTYMTKLSKNVAPSFYFEKLRAYPAVMVQRRLPTCTALFVGYS